jgi:hypothetical protein
MNILVLASEPIGAQDLRDALGRDVTADETQVMVVAPALQDSPIKFWLSDADGAIERADEVRRETLQRLGDAGVAAAADTGESDPFEAVEDTLRTFPADQVLAFVHPEGEQRYREQLDRGEFEQRFGVPVQLATVSRA